MRKSNNARTFLTVIMTSLALLTVCGKAEAATLVSEFIKDPVLRKKTMVACAANPGEMENKPDCINASNAQAKISLSFSHGKELSLCYRDKKSNSVPDSKCVDDFFAKQAK